MAEIEIERKKKPVWPWILLIILLAVIGWLVYDYMQDGTIGAVTPAASHGMQAQAVALPAPCYSANV